MATWKIYYGDGTVVEGDTEAQWNAAPAQNAQVVAANDPYPPDDPRNIGRLCWHGMDFYAWDGVPRGFNGLGVLDFLLRKGRITDRTTLAQVAVRDLTAWGIKMGRTIPHSDFDGILRRAVTDLGLQPKSGSRSGEDAIESLPRM